MFFYGNEAAMNVIAGLDELETAVRIIMDPGAEEPAKAALWKDYSLILAEVMATGGEFKITLDGGGWRKPLADAPRPIKKRIENALGFFAQLYGQSFRHQNVEVIA